MWESVLQMCGHTIIMPGAYDKKTFILSTELGFHNGLEGMSQLSLYKCIKYD